MLRQLASIPFSSHVAWTGSSVWLPSSAGFVACHFHSSRADRQRQPDDPVDRTGNAPSWLDGQGNFQDEREGNGMIMDEKIFSRTPRMELVEQYFSEGHFNAQEAFKRRKAQIIREMQSFEHDTGSFPVQIGLISERIAYLTKHCTTHRKDHHSRRGLMVLLSRRRKQLQYLRRQNFEHYVQVINKYNLKDNYYASGWGEVYRVGTNLKWTPSESDPDGRMVATTNMRVEMKQQRDAAKQKYLDKQARLEQQRQVIVENRRKRAAWVWQRRLNASAGLLPPLLAPREGGSSGQPSPA